MSCPLAIVNGRVITSRGDISSGVILIDGGVIVAAGPDKTVTLPTETLLIDAEKGTVSAGTIDAARGPVTVGYPADLVCRTRFGDVAWEMKAGVIVFPPDASPPPAAATWEKRRIAAIERVLVWLKQRPETVTIQRTDAIPGFRKQGIDILWRFQKDGQQAQSLSIRVIPSLDDHPARIFVLDGPSARKLPEAGLSKTKAHWWFYYHGPHDALYCFSTNALKKWMDIHAKEIPSTRIRVAGVDFQLSGRAIPVDRLQSDIDKARSIEL